MFPLELPLRLVRMYSFHGETVLDPFAGTGTTNLAAETAGRDSIGYEVNPGFEPLIRAKLAGPPLVPTGAALTFDRRPSPRP